MFKHILIALTGALLLGTAPAWAADTASGQSFVEGEAYVTLPTAQRYAPDDGKVELVEVFSYACIHCARFAPYMDKLVASLPDDVSVHYIPAGFSPAWEPFARAFYAARDLGVLKQTHDALFKDKFTNNYPINSLDDLANFYARHGVDRAAFLKAAKSDKTTQQLKADTELLQKWGIEGTPTIVVDGKYVSHHVRSYDELANLARWLVDRELGKSTP